MLTFDLFNSFPPEIHSIILSVCPPIDRTCLRLTCKSLYTLSSNEKRVPLSNETERLFCRPTVPDETASRWDNRRAHRAECHTTSYAKYAEERSKAGLRVPKETKCRTSYWLDHCTCFSRKDQLYKRLRTWVPKGLNYCSTCDKYTRRKASHKGRCYHGVRKDRACPKNFWTHRSRNGAFGYKLWKKFERNSDMDRFESRLRSETAERKGTERYSMRKWVPKDINTTEMRTGHGWNCS